jgi:hypothetical protein
MQYKNTQFKNRFSLKGREARLVDNSRAWHMEWLNPVQRDETKSRRVLQEIELPVIRF